MQNNINVVLPQQYDLVVGDTFQLFYRGVVEAPNPFCYDILAVCEMGRNYPRYFEFTPEQAGDYELTVSVFDADKTLLGSGTTTLHAVMPQEPEKPVNVLCIGDSLTSGGVWPHEAFRRLTGQGGTPEGHGFGNIRFLGTCEKDGAFYEGYGGWTWQHYLKNGWELDSAVWIDCIHNKTEADQHSVWQDEAGSLWQLETIEEKRLKFNRFRGHYNPKPESGSLTHYQNAAHGEPIAIGASYCAKNNPFYNEETDAADFKEYCKQNGYDGIDYVYILLGWNGLFENTDPIPVHCRHLAEQGRELTDLIRAAYPQAQIRIMGLQVPSVNGGTAASYGAALPYCDDYGLTRYVMELNRAYEAWTLEPECRDYMQFINISGQFDSDHNMPCAEKPVNTRSAKTEIVGTNGVHPAHEGYLQIADAVYRNMVASFAGGQVAENK